MSQTIIEMQNVSKVFRRGNLHDTLFNVLSSTLRWGFGSRRSASRRDHFKALDGVTFDVKRGESLAIIGKNGAGKSTILKLIAGILVPNQGAIITRGRIAALIEIGAGFHPEMTGRENIFLNAIIYGMSKSEIRKQFDSIVEFSGISSFLDTPLKRFSSGMRARLGFATAVHANADVLLVDEVLSVGDFAFQKKCLDHMQSLIRSGISIIFVSHNLKAVKNVCQRSLLLEDGKVVQSGPTDDIVRTYLERGDVGAYAAEEPTGVRIDDVKLQDANKNRTSFESGEPCTILVRIRALEDIEKVSISLYIEDDNFYNVFDTSSQRLGHRTLSLKKDQFANCEFRLRLYLGGGSYYLGILAHRYDIQRTLDSRFPAATIVVSGSSDSIGSVNVEPVILQTEPI